MNVVVVIAVVAMNVQQQLLLMKQVLLQSPMGVKQNPVKMAVDETVTTVPNVPPTQIVTTMQKAAQALLMLRPLI